MQKKYFLILFITLVCSEGFCQFYYSDILSTKIANNNYVILKNNKIKKISTVTGSKTVTEQDAINIVQTFSTDWESLKTVSDLGIGIKSVSTTHYLNNKISKKWDDGKNVNSLVRYTYDNNNQLISIIASSIDTTVLDGFFESHIFNYDKEGLPTQMFKIKNDYDTTFVTFLKDEQGNIAEERWTHNGDIIDTYYYYYNEKKQLTDVVKFNYKVKKMLPEFLFEYDEKGNTNKMTQIPFGSSNYLVWHYVHDNRGLKLAEFCYNKKEELLGKVEYQYE